jgi:hypothetical protein
VTLFHKVGLSAYQIANGKSGHARLVQSDDLLIIAPGSGYDFDFYIGQPVAFRIALS